MEKTTEEVKATVVNSKETKLCKEFLKHDFTQDEILEKGTELARINAEKNGIENEKKAVTSSFKAKIDAKDAEIQELSNHINNGFEHRYVQCRVQYNDPNTGYKTIVRLDTGEIVRKESMTAEELQLKFELQD